VQAFFYNHILQFFIVIENYLYRINNLGFKHLFLRHVR